MSNRFTRTFTALSEHIDINDHVNNAVWLRWMEDLAEAHWEAQARPQDKDKYVWMVLRHEIDDRGNISEGEAAAGETVIKDGPRGPRFDRHFSFADDSGKELVRAKTTFAMIDRASRRLTRVPAEVAASFAPAGGWSAD